MPDASCRAATPGCRACRRAPSRARRTLVRGATGRRPGSGGSAAGRGRGRSRSGSRRSRAAAAPSRTTLPARSAASDDLAVASVDEQLAGRRAPVLLHRRRAGRRAACRTTRGTRRPGCAPGCRRAAPRSASPGPARRPRSARGSARRRPARRRPGSSARHGPMSYPARASRRAAGRRWPGCPGRPRCRSGRAWSGSADSITTIRRSAGGMCRSRACAHGDAGDPGGPLGVGDVDGQPVGVDLLERERHGDEPAVELRDRHLGAASSGDSPSSLAAHVGAAAGQAQALQDRHVERGERADVPGLVVPAGRTRRRAGAAGGEHGDDQRVGRAQRRRSSSGSAGAQRGAEHRQRPAARRPRSRRTGPRRSAVFPARWCAR